MTKQAILESILSNSPWDLLLASGAVGAGGYTAAQLLHDVIKAKQRKEELEKPEGLVIPMPKPEQEQKKVAEEKRADLGDFDDNTPGNILLKLLGVGVGVPAGFIGANKLYSHFKQNQIDSDIQNEEKKRLDLMRQVQKLGEENTPNVDAFCEGLAKNATWWDSVAPGWMGGDKALQAAEKARADAKYNPGAYNFLSGGLLNNTAKTMAVLAALTAATTGGYMANAYNNKRKKEQSQYPQEVSIQNV